MPNSIDYYSFCLSPFTLFGHDAVKAVAEKHGISINYKPMKLFSVWEASGATPPAKRTPLRMRYRLVELSRIALERDIKINLKPAHWPTDPNLADNCAAVLAASGQNPHYYMANISRAVWCEEKNVADEAVVAEALTNAGLDAAAIIAKAGEGDAIRDQNTQDAIDADAVGAPAYVYKGEVFWGQDRVDALDKMISSGRDPIIFNEA